VSNRVERFASAHRELATMVSNQLTPKLMALRSESIEQFAVDAATMAALEAGSDRHVQGRMLDRGPVSRLA
jgi:hypothetical protein